MSVFTAHEVYEMAIQIEINGAAYYRKAAKLVANPDTNRLFLELAGQEDVHKQYFMYLKSLVSPSERVIIYEDEEVLSYIRAISDEAVFRPNFDSSAKVTLRKSPLDVIKLALETEKDSVIFYLTMKDSVPDKKGRERIDQIIREEMHHVQQLSQRILALKK